MSMQKITLILATLLLLAGCSGAPQTPAQPPTQPPPATATLEPTATPVPYNLDLMVKDPDGQPIPGASASLDGEDLQAGSSGVISFSNLDAGPLALTVSAPGYLQQDLAPTLQPGDNQVEVTLQPDPFGLLPAAACAEGETLLYLEDFQDGQAQGWDAIEAQVPGWSVEEEAGRPGNRLAAARGPNDVSWAWYDRENARFDNVIWRLRLKTEGASRTHLNFRFVQTPEFNGRYFISSGAGQAGLVRYVQDQHLDLGDLGPLSPEQWHLFEIAYFDGQLTVFVDGEQKQSYTEPEPWQGGTLNLEPYPDPQSNGQAAILYDNFSLCALSAPPQPLPRPKTGYDLALTITDLDGQPLPLAEVSLLDENGLPVGKTLTTDASGALALSDLPSGVLTVSVSAPGYLPLEQGLVIEKGEPAALTLALERDTLGLAPADACAAGETLLYIEDFNDGQAQGWPNISAAVELGAQNGWSILEQPTGNRLLQAANGILPASDTLQNFVFEDAVWRIQVYYEGSDTDGFLNWRHSFVDPNGAYGDWRYFVPFGGPHQIELIRFLSGDTASVAQTNVQLAPQKWHLFEISAYQGVIEVWLDGKKLLSYSDPQPLPPGSIGLEMHLREGVQTVFWFDDLAVCGLSAPFVPLSRLP